MVVAAQLMLVASRPRGRLDDGPDVCAGGIRIKQNAAARFMLQHGGTLSR